MSTNTTEDGVQIFPFRKPIFTENLQRIEVPTLVLHGDDDQVVPCQDAALLSARLLRNATLKIYPGFPHGMLTTHAEMLNADLLAFIRA